MGSAEASDAGTWVKLAVRLGCSSDSSAANAILSSSEWESGNRPLQIACSRPQSLSAGKLRLTSPSESGCTISRQSGPYQVTLVAPMICPPLTVNA